MSQRLIPLLTPVTHAYAVVSAVCTHTTLRTPCKSPSGGDPFPAGRFITCGTHMSLMQLMWSTHPHQPSQCTRLHEGPFRREGPSSPSQSQTHPPPQHTHACTCCGSHTHQRHAIGANLTDAAPPPFPTPTHTHVFITHLPSSGPYACHLPDHQFGKPMRIPEQPSAHTRPAQQPMPSGAQGLVRAAVTLREPSIDTL
jgi:hypothetical protein